MATRAASNPRFRGYSVVDCERDCAELLDRIHTQYYYGKGPNTAIGAKCDKEISFELSEFEWLCNELASIEALQPVTGWQLTTCKPSPGKTQLFLRHDVDGDIETAARMAEIEARYGLKGTFYLLPAGIYYSDWYWVRSKGSRPYLATQINRYTNMLPLYREIQNLGHEIGLHFFPYGAYREKEMNGVAHIVEEASWLRENGLEIRGGVGHSSAKAHGADSAEIFSEFRDPCVNCNFEPEFAFVPDQFEFDGQLMPRFCCSFEKIPLDYALEFRAASTGYWAVRPNGFIRYDAPRRATVRREDCTSIEGLVADIRRRISGSGPIPLTDVTLMIHPVHVRSRIAAERAREEEERARLAKQWSETIEVPLGKRPRSAPCVYEYVARNGTRIQIGHFVNSFGFVDFEPDQNIDADRMKIWILGGSLMESVHLQISNNLAGWLKKLYWNEDRERIAVRNLSVASMAFEDAVKLVENDDCKSARDAIVLEISRNRMGGEHDRIGLKRLLDFASSTELVLLGVAVDLFDDEECFVKEVCGRIRGSQVRWLGTVSLKEAFERFPPTRVAGVPDSHNWLDIGRLIKDRLNDARHADANVRDARKKTG